jgi:hypothetical protein
VWKIEIKRGRENKEEKKKGHSPEEEKGTLTN